MCISHSLKKQFCIKIMLKISRKLMFQKKCCAYKSLSMGTTAADEVVRSIGGVTGGARGSW
jgi:hypothetical protein